MDCRVSDCVVRESYCLYGEVMRSISKSLECMELPCPYKVTCCKATDKHDAQVVNDVIYAPISKYIQKSPEKEDSGHTSTCLSIKTVDEFTSNLVIYFIFSFTSLQKVFDSNRAMSLYHTRKRRNVSTVRTLTN